MLHLNGFLVFSFPHELIRICHFKFTFWVKLCAPNLTFERLLSFMNWFGMRNHYSDDVFEKKLCHNDLHSFLPSRTDSICLFRTYLYVRNFYNTHYIIIRYITSMCQFRYLSWEKIPSQTLHLYWGCFLYELIRYAHSYFHF